jgi:alkylation response protein AidB-like acyl-CoA dehydrogenase
MDLSYSAAHEGLRQEVRAFLEAHWPALQPGEPPPTLEQEAIFRRLAVERGYIYRHVPRRYGGAEQPFDPLREDILRQEFNARGAPMGISGGGPGMLVPTLLDRGTDEQRDEFIAATLHGQIRWCQGYSEPGSGSDLASLTSRAELDGDEWVIHGHKIWTSSAHVADWMFGLFRTEPDQPRHGGITYLLVPMHQPGVTVRPLRQMTGDSDFNEVFFDAARTHVRYQVGKRGEGWLVSRTTLKHERNMLGDPRQLQNSFDALVTLARSVRRGGRPAIEDPGIRQKLAKLEGYVLAQRFSGYHQLTAVARGRPEDAQATTLMNKLYSTELAKRLAELAYELVDDVEALRSPAIEDAGRRLPRAMRAPGAWTLQYIMSHAGAIAAGSSNIQRNIIGERVLGLPRDLRPGK